jgi:uncharacterized protein
MEPQDQTGQFSGFMFVNIESYKKSGEPKLTPVRAIASNGIVYFRTGPRTWKARRIRRNPQVRVIPCDQRGNLKGTWVNGSARILEGEELEQAAALFRTQYGAVGNFLSKLVYRLVRGQPLTTIVAVKLQNGQ